MRCDDKLRWLIQRGYLRSKRDIHWIFKRDLIDAGAEIRYNLELSQEELRASLYFALMQQSSALTLLYCVELIESQGSYSLKAFLDRTESGNNIFGRHSTSTGSGGGKAHRSLLNDPRIREVRTLLSTLRIEHPKLECLLEILKEKISYRPSSVIPTDGNAGSEIVTKGDYIVKAIVFTQYRDTAQHIVDILNSNGIKHQDLLVKQRKKVM